MLAERGLCWSHVSYRRFLYGNPIDLSNIPFYLTNSSSFAWTNNVHPGQTPVGRLYWIRHQACVQLTETFKRKQTFRSVMAVFAEGSEYPQLFSSCLLAKPRWRPIRIKFLYACSLQKIWKCLLGSFINSIPYKNKIKNKYWYNSFDLISSLVNENNDCSLIWDQIIIYIRVYNNRSEDAK